MVIADCAGAPRTSVQRCVLGVAAAAAPPPAETTRGMRLALLNEAPYLGADGSVMQTSGVAVNEAHNSLWAEYCHARLRLGLRRQLARRMQGRRVLEQGDPDPPSGDLHRLEVEVSPFQGRYAGFAVAGGARGLHDGDGRLLGMRQFSVQHPPAADGYQALVGGLTAVWRSGATDFALAVEQRLPP